MWGIKKKKKQVECMNMTTTSSIVLVPKSNKESEFSHKLEEQQMVRTYCFV